MSSNVVKEINVCDARYPLRGGAGGDSVHTDPIYSYAATEFVTQDGLRATGLAFTLGKGNEHVCNAIPFLAESLRGRDIEEIMADFGILFRSIADNQYYRWLGPHKGVVHLALASIVNACFDLWAKSRGLPLWKLLLELSTDEILNLLDLSYLEDILTLDDARDVLDAHTANRAEREAIIDNGYPAYDTSFGWLSYEDDRLVENARRSLDAGFTSLKLKVGSPDPQRDIRRAHLIRKTVGTDVNIMLDANQVWSLQQSLDIGKRLAGMTPYWLEEPTHPDDILAHQVLSRELAPCKIAIGEHVPNRVVFKNYLQNNAVDILQVDCTRVGGVSEFITVSLLARKFGVPVVPHVGDMGQIQQHLVLFNHIALGCEALFLECISDMKEHFVHPAQVENGLYRTPQEPGSSSDLKV